MVSTHPFTTGDLRGSSVAYEYWARVVEMTPTHSRRGKFAIHHCDTAPNIPIPPRRRTRSQTVVVSVVAHGESSPQPSAYALWITEVGFTLMSAYE